MCKIVKHLKKNLFTSPKNRHSIVYYILSYRKYPKCCTLKYYYKNVEKTPINSIENFSN